MPGATLFDPADGDSALHQPRLPEEKNPPHEADVLIVGAGIIGLTTAYRLQKAGRDVVLFDPEPASEATRAAAGMLAPASEVQFRQEPLVPLMKDAAALYADLARQVEEESGIKVGLRTTRTLVCAADSADRQSLEDLRAYQEELGLATSSLSVRQARKIEPVLAPSLSGAVEILGDHQINPRWFAAALEKVLAENIFRVRAEEILVEQDAVTGVKRARGVTWKRAGEEDESGGRTFARQIVLANGLGTLGLAGLAELQDLPLRPVYGDVIRLRVPASQQPFLENTIRGVVRGFPVYIVPRQDNTVVIGASSREDSMSGVNAGGIYQLLRDARELVPAITELEIYELISRARPGSPDDLPLIGPLESQGKTVENLTLANGFFRHGILLSARASELLTHLLTGELTEEDRRDLGACDPQRFSPTT